MIGRTILKRSHAAAALGLVMLVCAASPAADTDSPARQQAREVLDTTGVQGGVVVDLGCRDGKLAAALGIDERYLVHALDADADNVRAAREHVRSRGLYGRVSIEHWTANTLPYNDNQVNLLIVRSSVKVPERSE